jgi:FKBP-type peptidyl-prolyl isomerase-like protein
MTLKLLDTMASFAYRALLRQADPEAHRRFLRGAQSPRLSKGLWGFRFCDHAGGKCRWAGNDRKNNYTLRLDSGQVVDSSDGRDPLVFHFGQDQIIPGLEREMTGMQSGDQTVRDVHSAGGGRIIVPGEL